MPIQEPMTMATDYLVAALAVWWGVAMVRRGRRDGERSALCWGAAFLALAVGAIAGGTSHGFAVQLGESGHRIAWKLTVYALGVASFFLAAAAAYAFLAGVARRALLGAAAVGLGFYAVWMASRDDFLWVIVDYGSAMLVVLALALWGWLGQRREGAAWIVVGVAISVVAALIQQSGVVFHRHFNHNDLYHLVQIGGLWAFFRGGMLVDDRRPASRASRNPGARSS